ncbi:S-adenosyl-L-methionine-dependent tRNA 4-demethylwyosine synthase TYW1-like [Rhynchocyon petersi]
MGGASSRPRPLRLTNEIESERAPVSISASGRDYALGPPLPPLNQSGLVSSPPRFLPASGMAARVFPTLGVQFKLARVPRNMDDSLATWDFFSPLIMLWIYRVYLYYGFAFGITLWICVQIMIKKQLFILKDKKWQEKSVPEVPWDLMTHGLLSHHKTDPFVSEVKIFYGSQTGTAKGFAAILAEAVNSLGLPVTVINLEDFDPDDHLVEEVACPSVCIFLLATYTDGQPPESASWFCKWLEEAATDFRFGRTYLKGLRYAVFGLGNSAYASHFNKVSKNVDKWLWQLGARRVLARGVGDCNVVSSRHGSIEADFSVWRAQLLARLQELWQGEEKPGHGDSRKGQRAAGQREDSPLRGVQEEEPQESSSEDEEGSLDPVVDLEDLGSIMGHVRKQKPSCPATEDARPHGRECNTPGRSLEWLPSPAAWLL